MYIRKNSFALCSGQLERTYQNKAPVSASACTSHIYIHYVSGERNKPVPLIEQECEGRDFSLLSFRSARPQMFHHILKNFKSKNSSFSGRMQVFLNTAVSEDFSPNQAKFHIFIVFSSSFTVVYCDKLVFQLLQKTNAELTH